MVTAKDCHVLITYYRSQYQDKYGRAPVVNRNIARWNVENMLQDMSMVDFKELVDYYMRTGGSHRHSWQWFANHYDELVESKKERDADIETREKLREQTKRRTEEWRQKKVDNNSRETD